MDTLSAEAPAKINLMLRVLGTRPDGFHEIESLAVHINLCDTLTVHRHEDGCYALECDDPSLPCDGSNLVLQAARALACVSDRNLGVRMELRKRIPTGAGLGGGSSDAATTLRVLSRLWKMQVSDARLMELGALLGSDVPLFLQGPICVLRGRGERVEPVGARPAFTAALVLPELHCSTPAVYRAWDRQAQHPARPRLDEVLEAMDSAEDLMRVVFNDLEAAAFEVEPRLAELAGQVRSITGQAIGLTGSGAGLFRLFDDHKDAARFAMDVGTGLNVRTYVATLRTVA